MKKNQNEKPVDVVEVKKKEKPEKFKVNIETK